MKLLFFCLPLLTFAGRLDAQNLSIEASLGASRIRLDEQALLFVTVRGAAANLPTPRLPALPEFDVYSTGRAHQLNIVNGQVTASVQFTYVLVPKSPGRHSIPPIQVSQDNETASTQAMTLEVQAIGAAPPKPAAAPTRKPGPARASPSPGEGEPPLEGVMLRASVDKKKAFVQEQVILSIQFLRRVRFLTRPTYTPPSITGWTSYDLPPREFTTTIEGLGFSVTEFRYALFPTSSGSRTIGPALVQCSIENFQADPFDALFQNFFRAGETRTLKTEPLTVEILPLPDSGKPSPFTGSVGRFTIRSGLDKNTVKTGEPVTLTAVVEGEGHVKTAGEPFFNVPSSFRRYETLTSLSSQGDTGNLSGKKEFKTVLVAQEPGAYSIGPVRFNYFNPQTRRYHSLETPPLTLSVTPGSPAEARPVSPALRPKGAVKILEQDIRFIKPPAGPARAPALPGGRTLLILNGAPWLLLGGAAALRTKRRRDLENPDEVRFRRAFSAARSKARGARPAFRSGSVPAALSALSSALAGYVADKIGQARPGVSLAEAMEFLGQKGVPEPARDEFKALWEELDRARFSPAQIEPPDGRLLVERTLALLARIERRLR